MVNMAAVQLSRW